MGDSSKTLKDRYSKVLTKELLKNYIFGNYVELKEKRVEHELDSYRQAQNEKTLKTLNYIAKLEIADELLSHPVIADHPKLSDLVYEAIVKAIELTVESVVDSGLIKPNIDF